MTEHPIIFSGEMVRAILDGRKTMTRRVINHGGNCFHNNYLLGEWSLSDSPRQYDGGRLWRWRGKKQPKINDWIWELQTDVDDSATFPIMNPYGQVGDRLWVRETWTDTTDLFEPLTSLLQYKADNNTHPFAWKPSIYMPRWASRITLEITNIMVERLQEITEEDAGKEGVGDPYDYQSADYYEQKIYNGIGIHICAFAGLWDSINGKKYPWSSNPWVWVIEFKMINGATNG